MAHTCHSFSAIQTRDNEFEYDSIGSRMTLVPVMGTETRPAGLRRIAIVTLTISCMGAAAAAQRHLNYPNAHDDKHRLEKTCKCFDTESRPFRNYDGT